MLGDQCYNMGTYELLLVNLLILNLSIIHTFNCRKNMQKIRQLILVSYVDVVRSSQNLNMLKTDTISIKFD